MITFKASAACQRTLSFAPPRVAVRPEIRGGVLSMRRTSLSSSECQGVLRRIAGQVGRDHAHAVFAVGKGGGIPAQYFSLTCP